MQETNSDSVDIYNGDVLASQIIHSTANQHIVFRECMMDGPLIADSFDEFVEQRAAFIMRFFDVSSDEYYLKSKPELEKIEAIDDEVAVYLWFEYDIFCQFNLWYVCWRLLVNHCHGKIFWVRPSSQLFDGFTKLDADALTSLKSNALCMSSQELQHFATLWVGISTANKSIMQVAFEQLKQYYPADFDAVKYAWRYKYETDSSLHPAVFAKELSTLQSDKTGLKLFSVFQQEYSHYGIGDAQFFNYIKDN